MKKFILALVLVLVASVASAAPFLVCDPYPDESKPARFEMLVDGQTVQTQYALHTSGSAIVLDLAGYSDGAHYITELKACNERGCSTPVPFVIPGVPGSITGMKLSP